MDCCHSHCACCAHRHRSREKPRGLYFVPVLIEEDDYEPEPLYFHPYQYFPQVLPSRKSRTWSRRVNEEEEEEKKMFETFPRRFSFYEENARKKKIEARKQEENLQSLAHRLEALELGFQRLITLRNCPHPEDQPRSEVTEEKFIKKKSFVMSPEEAALIIQSRFRAYLVRRSETLRHLRDLAVVKSTLKELHCLYADSRYRRVLCRDADERNLFSEKATALLLKVDSIQGCEPMVREARRALSKELVTLLDSLDCMGAQYMEQRTQAHQPRVNKEHIMMRDRVIGPRNCIECSGEVAIPAEDEEEEMDGSRDWRAPPSERRYFPRPVCKSNRGRHSHGPRQCRSSGDFDASAFDNSKTRIPFISRKKFGSPGHLLRDEMAGINDMDQVGFGRYWSSAALPF